MSKDKKAPAKRSNRFNVEWCYAQACYSALRDGLPIPPLPQYETWQMDEHSGKWQLIKTADITPNKVTYGGVTLFGD